MSLTNCSFSRYFLKLSYTLCLCLSSVRVLQSSVTCLTINTPPQVQTCFSCPCRTLRHVSVASSKSGDANVFATMRSPAICYLQTPCFKPESLLSRVHYIHCHAVVVPATFTSSGLTTIASTCGLSTVCFGAALVSSLLIVPT